MSFWHFVLLFFAMAFGIGALAIVMEHLQKMASIKAQARAQHSEAVERRLEELAQQVAELRQMHTEHVLSIDSHIQHLDYKLSALESRLEQIEQRQNVGR